MAQQGGVPDNILDWLCDTVNELELSVEELRKRLDIFCREVKYFSPEYAIALHGKYFRRVREADDRLLVIEKKFRAYFIQMTQEEVNAILASLSLHERIDFINSIGDVIGGMTRILNVILKDCDPLVKRSRVMIHQMMTASRRSWKTEGLDQIKV